MKRLTKICVITALILGISGGILFCTGIAMGGTWDIVRETAGNSWLWSVFDRGTDWKDTDTLDECRDKLGEKAKTEYEFFADEVQDIEIDVKNAYLSVVDSETSDKIKVRIYHEQDDVEFDREDGELTIERESRRKYLDKYPIQIEIPADKKFRSADIQIEAGVLEADNLAADEIDLEMGAGTAEVFGEITALQTSLSVGMGTMDIGMLDSLDTEIECGMGSVDVTLAKNRDLYYAEVECAMGSVDLGDEVYSSVSSSYSGREQDAEREIRIECGMGSVDVSFEEMK